MHTGTQRDRVVGGLQSTVGGLFTVREKNVSEEEEEDKMLGEKLCEMGCVENTCKESVG